MYLIILTDQIEENKHPVVRMFGVFDNTRAQLCIIISFNWQSTGHIFHILVYSFFIVSTLAIACEDLPDPSNGEINFSLDKTAPFEFETTATYSCDPGFGISGGDPVRTCGGDGSSPSGEWTGNASTCEGQFSIIACPRDVLV